MRLGPLVIFAAGATIALVGWRLQGDAAASRGWPEARGVIESAEVTSRSDGHEQRLYGASVRYRYDVAGKRYTGERVSYESGQSPQREIAEGVIRRYAPGTASGATRREPKWPCGLIRPTQPRPYSSLAPRPSARGSWSPSAPLSPSAGSRCSSGRSERRECQTRSRAARESGRKRRALNAAASARAPARRCPA